MTLRTDYSSFLRVRLCSRIDDLQAAFATFVADPPPIGSRVEIVIFPDDGLTESPPLRVFAFTPAGTEQLDDGGIGRCNDVLASMSPLLTADEVDRFQIWECEGSGRMVAMEQPIDGIDEELLKSWVAHAWLKLDLSGYACCTAIAVHDGEAEIIFTR